MLYLFRIKRNIIISFPEQSLGDPVTAAVFSRKGHFHSVRTWARTYFISISGHNPFLSFTNTNVLIFSLPFRCSCQGHDSFLQLSRDALSFPPSPPAAPSLFNTCLYCFSTNTSCNKKYKKKIHSADYLQK